MRKIIVLSMITLDGVMQASVVAGSSLQSKCVCAETPRYSATFGARRNFIEQLKNSSDAFEASDDT